MKELDIKKRLEEKIIFGDGTYPVTCLIYTLDLNQDVSPTASLEGSDCKKIKVINMDTLIEEKMHISVDEILLERTRSYMVSFGKSKLINNKAKSSSNLKIDASLNISILGSEIKTKSINCSDMLENINGNIKVCVLYIHSENAPIIKIKSLDQFNKDLESFDYGFDITNLSENNLIYNSHYSRVTIEEKKIKITNNILLPNIDSMTSQIKDNIINEEFIMGEKYFCSSDNRILEKGINLVIKDDNINDCTNDNFDNFCDDIVEHFFKVSKSIGNYMKYINIPQLDADNLEHYSVVTDSDACYVNIIDAGSIKLPNKMIIGDQNPLFKDITIILVRNKCANEIPEFLKSVAKSIIVPTNDRGQFNLAKHRFFRIDQQYSLDYGYLI